jgi:hypothetical protein
MKRLTAIQSAFAVALLCIAGPGSSHHSPASVYILNQEIHIEGVVTDYRYNNPHVRIFIDVVNEDGETENWIAEGGTPNIMLRNGWSGETFKVGDPIQVRGHPPRAAGSNFIHMEFATLPDGSELYGEDVQGGIAEQRRRSRRRE